MAPLILRTIEHEDGFDALAAQLFGGAERADAALSATIFELSNEPALEQYPVVDADTPQGKLRAFKTVDLPAFPSMVVYFTIGDGRATLHDIIDARPDPEEL